RRTRYNHRGSAGSIRTPARARGEAVERVSRNAAARALLVAARSRPRTDPGECLMRERDDDQINFVKEALNWQYNWIAMAGAAAFALVSGSALPILLGAGFELMYLSVVPNNGRFQRLVRSWKWAEE